MARVKKERLIQRWEAEKEDNKILHKRETCWGGGVQEKGKGRVDKDEEGEEYKKGVKNQVK
jgi:hypothetical protein